MIDVALGDPLIDVGARSDLLIDMSARSDLLIDVTLGLMHW